MQIKTSAFITSLAEYGAFPGKGLPQICVAGKSNVGKSSLINCLANRKKLAKTSNTPGKTRLINIYLMNNAFHLVDLPGYGYAKVNKKEQMRWGGMMQRYFSAATELVHVLHLVDIRHEPTMEDKEMSLFLRKTSVPRTVIVTKADKISRAARPKHLLPILRAMEVQPWEAIPFSSEDGSGRDKVLSLIASVIYQDTEFNVE